MKKFLIKIYKFLAPTLRPYFRGKIFYKINSTVFNSLKSDYSLVDGHKMFLDSKDSLNLSINDSFEQAETELVKREVKEGDIVLDIGANIGYYTLIFAKLVGPRGKVFAFEPDPLNFSFLKKNIDANGYSNVVLIQKAVSDKSGSLRLFLSKDNKGDHRIYDSGDGRDSLEISSITVDSLLDDLFSKVDFIKIDIQGAEWAALNGMKSLLSINKRIKILSEFWPVGLTIANASPKKYLEFFFENKFQIFELFSETKKLQRITEKNLSDKIKVEKDNLNIFCVRD